jgi:predicted N-acyltransferase
MRRPDAIWITEPASQTAWLSRDQDIDVFEILPMVHVDLHGIATFEEYVRRLPKKRRRNQRVETDAFNAAGASIEFHGRVEDPDLLAQMYRCLQCSAQRSVLSVPYNDVMTDSAAFATQVQMSLVATLNGRVIGFVSFIQDGPNLLQCHGGLDYADSIQTQAYHNLMYAAIEHAIRLGGQRLSLGPLNNETKRRIGNCMQPVKAGLWNRSALDRAVARHFFIPNLHVAQFP